MVAVRKVCARLFCAFAFAASAMFAPSAAAEGLAAVRAVVLYDGPAASAGELLILSRGYPLKQISAVTGWRKVLLPGGENGWVRAAEVRKLKAAVALSEGVIVRADPGENAAGVFFAQAGVVLEVLGQARPGWWQVLHADGEAGYAAAGEVWVNF